MKKKLIVIGGATASGKTTLAIRLAQQFKTEILSADSRQFYREMHIGTAKPTPAELAAAPHHFIDSLSIHENYTVGDFERDALRVLDKIFLQHDVAVLVGGSGLFIRAVCEGLDDFPPVPTAVKHFLEEKLKTEGLPSLQTELRRLDEKTAAQIDLQNPARVLRALSVCLASGQPYANFLKKKEAERSFEPIFLLLDWPREQLYARINARVDFMMAAGLEQEARSLYPYRHLTALQTVGYTEFFDFFDEKTSRADCISLIKQHSRNYAKRQTTWFRKEAHWHSFHPDSWPLLLDFLRLKINSG